ncbi:YsnF/AvaK domain-containing protein [Erwinia sp.]|uniref:YsnF/AvaK domain-containing protein n=1 Tax=Erwinia citreus TaxID=558 RepID=UPI00289D03D3|nr:YsnF/AvaK domain-containing protein [Erwinia sp.]
MSHEKIVTAFNEVSQAEAAKQKLIVEGIAEKNIDIISGERLRVEDKEIRHPSFWQRLFGDDVDDDYASEYSKAIRSGGVLLTVRAPKDEADHIEQELSAFAADYSSLSHTDRDMANRDYAGQTNDRGLLTGDQTSAMNTTTAPMTNTGNTMNNGTLADDTLINERDSLRNEQDSLLNRDRTDLAVSETNRDSLKLAEEQVDIGKRQINDGSVRLRRFTVEDEVAEDISLYDQHAEVFRHAVDEPAYLNDVDWSEKTIEVEESHEIPTVAKTTRIKEEVGLRGEETARVETVKDSVRRQEVEVEHTNENRMQNNLTGTNSLKDDVTRTENNLRNNELTDDKLAPNKLTDADKKY